MSDASIVWAAYATAIATLGGLASQSLGATQRFSINPQNTFSIPVVPFVNQLYQNFNVHRFASVVPDKDIAVLTPNGQNYDTAYGIYLDNVFIQVPNDPRIQAKINETSAKLDGFRRSIQDLKKRAQRDFFADAPNGIDPFTGKSITLAEYASIYYPEIASTTSDIAEQEAIRAELVNENIGGEQLERLNTWRDALDKGEDQDTSFPNYNMGVLQADASTVIGVSGGLADANTQATSFENAFSIGGQFNTVAKAWIDSFPSEYPGDRRRYDAGKSTYAVNNITHTTNNWSQFGYSSSTQSTGSSGWIFWSTGSSETDTTTRNVVNIDEASFGTGIEVSAWGIATFPIQYGQWYQGNPLRTYPVLVNTATQSVVDDVKQQITSVIMGYGVEVSFTLLDSAYQSLTGAITEAKSKGGHVSIFGGIYGSSDGSYTTTTNTWEDIYTHDGDKRIILRAQNVKVPQVLGTIITTIGS